MIVPVPVHCFPITFARVCGHVDDFRARGECLTAGLLGQGCRCRGLRGAFFWVLSTALWVGFGIQCRVRVAFASGLVGAGVLW